MNASTVRRCEARVGGVGACYPAKNLKTQFNLVTSSTFSCSLFLVHEPGSHKILKINELMDFYVIYLTLKSF